MKRFSNAIFLFSLLLLILRAGAQQPAKYEKEWNKVSQLTNKQLPKSAIAEAKKIYILAKKENQDAHVIKALIFITQLQEEISEEEDIFSVKEFEKELVISKEPVRSILNSLLAENYWNYYRNHRWQLYNRTPTTGFKKDDIATWGAEDFHRKISELYLASVSSETILKQTRLEPYDAIIIKGNVRHLRPTLFDLLAHRALAYFENDERDLNRPAFAFEINQASAFDPAADFINRKFITADSLSLQHKALMLYQKLIAFHINDARPAALIDADISRIEFVNSKSVHPDKDQLYFNTINHIAHQYENLPEAAQAWFLVAKYYEDKAYSYQPFGDSTHRLDRLKAKEICEKVLAQKDSSEGRINCYNLLNSILEKSFQFNVEKVNIPMQPFRALFTYRNVNTIYLRLIKADEKLKTQLQNQHDNNYWESIIAATPLKSWQQALPATGDYQQHKTEIKIDALPAGNYLLLASTSNDIKAETAILGASIFYVSSIAFVQYEDDFFVLNRENGQPLNAADVQVWEQKYDYTASRYTKQKSNRYRTDANGFFRMDIKREANNRYNYTFQLDISHHGERLFMDDMINKYYYYNPADKLETTSKSIHLFIDRSLYRPGQTIYFKGIVLSKKNGSRKSEALAGHENLVYLQNLNNERVDSLKVISNEFGSFSGSFQLPSSGLNGQFNLLTKTDNGNAYFYVEEYKRPKFYVEYEPVKGTYKVDDTIKITGIAKAYAGNNIDGATVKYRVVRQPRFLYPWLFWRWWQPPSEPMEITHGEVKTNASGEFIVEFKAIPDLKIEKKFEPVFDYTVYADVTDINGETRSGEQTVPVSYKALIIKTTIPATLPADSLQDLSIRTENLNGEFQKRNVKVTITSLKPETRLIRERFWERPDQFTMTKQEYIQYFPHDEYDNEADYRTWEKGQQVFEKMDSSRENSKFPLSPVRFEPGYYMIEISSTDKNGEEVKDIHYIELYNETSNRLSKPQYLWTDGSRPIEPGETTSVRLGTTASNIFVVQQLNKQIHSATNQPADSSAYSFFKLDNEKKTIQFSASEADRGGYGINWFFVSHNRFYQYNDIITVPWTNKNLSIEYATYRDKTLPGSEEKWTLKIKGHKNDKLAAEMLASMYDASLDQFYPHQWQQPAIWPDYYSNKSWNAGTNFNKQESLLRWVNHYEFNKFLRKEYDQLASGVYSYELEQTRVAFDTRKRRGEERLMEVSAAPQVMVADGNMVAATDSTAVATTGGFNYTQSPQKTEQGGDVQVRKNFNETAFFFPALRTDSAGAIEFSFTMPEALTRWKFQALAHTKELAFGYSSREIITQKQLMVQPNAPRFLREGDKIELSSKLVNLTEKELTGQASLQLIDAATNQSLDNWFKNTPRTQSFTIPAGKSIAIIFPLDVPHQFNKALVWRIVATATAGPDDNFSDGEENALPVLTNRMLVTETLPLSMKHPGTRSYSFEKLLQSGNSPSLQHHALTIEYTSNPAWYAIQALPYLMEYPYDCAEQTWNRYYANSLAAFIANSSPRIKQVFEQWKIKDTAALLSNLQKNPELKAVLLEETPWVLQAKTETEQKNNIALLFDMVRMSRELNNSYEKLKQMQSSNGGFVWFKDGPDDRFMTQYIVSGIGHLAKLKSVAAGQESKLDQILTSAIPYLDKKIKEDYDRLIKDKTNLKTYIPGHVHIQYLYMRSFFPAYKIPPASQAAYTYFRSRAGLTWTKQNKYMQGMIALALGRTGDTKTPAAILRSLRETSINNEELGMYWKDTRRGWWWHEAPVERQALLIEAFQEIGKDNKTVNDLRTWLLKNKQTNHWESTKATAEACYALLLQGTQWLTNEPAVSIQLGSTTIMSTDEKTEAGTGYFKKSIEAEKINPGMGNISITTHPLPSPLTGNQPGWGAVYWQYFEDLDKITVASTPLSLTKKLFVETNTDRGPVLSPVNNGARLKIGDKIKVRIELRVDREMEYVHMKDMRASCLEPVNVLSSYKWQGGLGYYETTKDASTNFFFGNLGKGTYVFEYSLFITHAGDFSNGITSIQCMYAPEFSSHSEGIRIHVD